MPRSGRHALLATASVAVALAAADTYVVVLALTDMMAGVGIGVDALQRATPIISGFLLGYIAVLPLIGRLSDLLDRRRVLLGCLVVFTVGSAVTALATDLLGAATFAASVILAWKSLETGQPVSAAFAALWNASSDAPGTLAVTARCDAVTLQPVSPRSSEIVAVVLSVLGTSCALPSSAASAIVKHPAWAAARSSSGFVPLPPSNRAANE